MKPIRSHDVSRASLALQPLLYGSKPRAGAVQRAMRVMDRIAQDMRRKEVFEAGAKARKPKAIFRGQELGSNETCTFYDGFASTHPEFENPYRRRS